MILVGCVRELKKTEDWLDGKRAEVADVSCSLKGPQQQPCSITISVPIAEAEHWPLGMPVTVTVKKGEPDEPAA